jgi:ABC-type uncharacterized transport system substrate-binding protein
MRLIGLAVAVFLALAPFAADAQQAGKVPRVGILSSGSAAFNEVPAEGRRVFRERLSDLGWIVGQNLTFESRYAEGNLERLPGLAAELVQLKVSMIVALGTQPSLAAKRATATIPIVIIAGDPVGSGLIASLAHPGGNITGLTMEAGLEIFSKRLDLLKQAAPKISRVGILANRSNTSEARFLDAMAPVAQALRLTFLPVEVRTSRDFADAFSVLSRERVDALTATENPLNMEHRGSIVSFAARNRLPTMFGERLFVDAGGLMSYGISFIDLFRHLPTYMDKILRARSPAISPSSSPPRSSW